MKIIEEWKPIKDYENLYEVSSLGRIRSLKRQGTNGELLKIDIRKDGYLQTHLVKNGKMKNYLVHRLVAIAFIPNVNNYKEVNHIDGDKSNNGIDNLEWCTREDNMKHAYKIGLKSTKKIKQYDKEGNLINIWESIREAGRKTGINQSHITKCCKGIYKTAGSCKWRYVNEG